MRLSYCIATMGRDAGRLERLLRSLSAQTDRDFEAVVVLQTRDADTEASVRALFELSDLEGGVHCMSRFGLSASRNQAFCDARGEVLVLCDEDCTYPADSAQIIKQAYAQWPDAELITFKITSGDGDYTRYDVQPRPHTLRSLMRVSSVEVTLRRPVAERLAPLFDERVGLGTRIPSGAENLMLANLFRKGVRMRYVPKTIVQHPVESSGRGSGAVDIGSLAFAKGYLFSRLFGLPLGSLVAIGFFARHWLGNRPLRFRAVDFPQLCRGIAVAGREAIKGAPAP